MDSQEKLKKLLADHGRSVTRQRLAVFEALAVAGPLTAAQLAKNLAPVADKVSVYRAVDLFVKIGVAHRVWTGFKSKIELSEDFSPHHHHFTCTGCAKTIELASDELEKTLDALAKKHGFKPTHHSVELSGTCTQCRNGSAT